MDKVAAIENQIEQLSADEFSRLRQWFIDYDNENWDVQIEADSAAGKLDALANRALLNHTSGR